MKASFPVLASVALVAGTASAAHASIQYFNNAGGAFVWESSTFFSEFIPGTFLDITQPPSQSGAQTPFSIQSFSEPLFFSRQFVTTTLVADDASRISFARGPHQIMHPLPDIAGECDPAVALASGVMIDGDVPGAAWSDYADVNFRADMIDQSLIGGRSFVGVKLHMADGVHFGWIDLQDNGYNANPSFVPLAWAYETTPDTPLPAGVVPAPGTLSLLALTAAPLLARRRRR